MLPMISQGWDQAFPAYFPLTQITENVALTDLQKYQDSKETDSID